MACFFVEANKYVGAGVRVQLSETLRSHGWRSRAYMDVFTACFGELYPHPRMHQKQNSEPVNQIRIGHKRILITLNLGNHPMPGELLVIRRIHAAPALKYRSRAKPG